MRKFVLGFVVGIIVIIVAAILWVRFGLVDPRADVPENSVERAIAMPALDASVDRRAPEMKNPIDPTDANLVAGMEIYQTNCASCHGDIGHQNGTLANGLYPRAPQFMDDAPDMPENQNFYIIQHGIRLSAMPAWSQSLNDQQMWQVTTFLSHMDKLPAPVSDQWKAAAAGPSSASSPAPPSSPQKNK